MVLIKLGLQQKNIAMIRETMIKNEKEDLIDVVVHEKL